MARNLYEKVCYRLFESFAIGIERYNRFLMIISSTSPTGNASFMSTDSWFTAFEGLRNAGRKVRRPDCTLATTDHNIPTDSRANFKSASTFIKETDSRTQVVTLEENVVDFGLTYFGMADKRQGIVHVIGPEQGFTLPGTIVVCGDSHTSTHGAFGALAFGIGTSEVEHVLATQTIIQKRSKTFRIHVNGDLSPGVTPKDVMLHIIGTIGTAGGTGSVIEFGGSVFDNMSMEGRMSVCNMSIEAGARAGMVAPDEITFAYLRGRPLAPAPDSEEWQNAVKYWKSLRPDPGAKYDRELDIDAKDIQPTVTWGTSPQDVVAIGGSVPDPAKESNPQRKAGMLRALEYMGLEPNVPMEEVKIDKVFIGSCTNSRIEDLRAAAAIADGRRVADHVYAMVVPGSGLIKVQAEKEGLDRIFRDAGFDWREAGCSMCLGMNPDQLKPGERCASTSNRNFEGRQGAGGRTHLMSPAMAAAAAITGRLTDVRKLATSSAVGDKEVTKAKLDLQAPPKAHGVESQPVEAPVDESTDGEAASAAAPKAPASTPAGVAKFVVWKGIAAPLDKSNVDTDAIIPKQFLKTIKRTGLGKALFNEWRYDIRTNEENPDFVLNKEPYRSAKILVVGGPNFGCGSSREHAPWALLDFGIRCIIASSYADIFFNNTFKNGMLPLVLPEEQVAKLLEDAKAGQELEIDLPAQVVRRPNGEEIPFEVDQFRKHCLVNGLDDINLTLQNEDKIQAFEEKRSAQWPWLDGVGYKGKIPVNSAQTKKKIDW